MQIYFAIVTFNRFVQIYPNPSGAKQAQIYAAALNQSDAEQIIWNYFKQRLAGIDPRVEILTVTVNLAARQDLAIYKGSKIIGVEAFLNQPPQDEITRY